jgi:GNAT superfamily N-acetyltransferase
MKGVTIVIRQPSYRRSLLGPTYYAVTDDGYAARVETETVGDAHFAVHLDCWPEFRRRGITSWLVDQVVAMMAARGRSLLFEDQQEYLDAGGIGTFTPVGQAWADAYRQRRGIPLPPTYVPAYMAALELRTA